MAVRTSGTYGGKFYRNGQMPASLLVRVDGLHGASRNLAAYLRPDAADAFNRVRRDAAKIGLTVTLRGWYRSLGSQRVTYNRYLRGGNPAALPGYSNHGLGVAIDIADVGGKGQFNNARRARLAPILRKHGFTDTEGRRVGEPWHWEYNGSRDRGRGSKAPAKKAAGPKRKPRRPLTIRQGSTRGRIRLLQKVLAHTGDYRGKVDAKFGPATDKAVRRFQRRAGLVADGIVGPKTWFRLCQGIRKGTRGPRVKLLQLICGMTGGGVSGLVGNVTVRNMKKVQRWLGVTADGVWGPKTISALMKRG